MIAAVRQSSSRAAPIVAPRTTQQLVDLVLGTPYEALPQSAVHATKRLILDMICVTVAAFKTPMAEALLKLKRDPGGRPEATLILDGARIPAQSAAYIHAHLANLLDADETLLNRTHTLSANVMTGLAVAERTSASGKELIAAIATGYDISSRVGLSLQQYVQNGQGGTVFAQLFGFGWMTFGATATAGRLLGLNPDQLANAYGQAFVTTPIIFDIPRQNRPFYQHGMPANWHRYQMPGVAAEAGINAALLAAEGWIAQRDILDEGSEFWRSFGALGCNWDIMYAERAPLWYIEETSIKPYPFCRFGHASLDLFSSILKENRITADDIEEVIVRVPPLRQLEELAENVEVDDPLKLMVSLPSAMALIAMGIPAGPGWFNADLKDSRLRQIAHKVRSVPNPEWGPILAAQIQAGGVFRRTPSEVTVRTKNSVFSKSAENALGDPWVADYVMSDAQLIDKVYRFVDGRFSRERADRLIDAVFALDGAPNIGTIVAAMHNS